MNKIIPLQHQEKMNSICTSINGGSGVTDIYCDVCPGGGKTFMALMAINKLVGGFVDYAIVIVPRSNLQRQFESDCMSEFIYDGNILRAAENSNNLLRGCQGYITTFQAICAKPELHKKESLGKRYMVVVDEVQHLIDDSAWQGNAKEIIDNAAVRIFMTGTLDTQSGFIYGVDYVDGVPQKIETKTRKWITYSRSQALADEAILPVDFSLFGASGSYEKDGVVTDFSEIGFDKSALLASVSSSAALEILDNAYKHYSRYKKEIGDYAQMITVDASIKNAKRTRDYLLSIGANAVIATSEDHDCAETIASFCDGKIQIICTVGTVYEGLNAPRCTHLVLLTHICSKPWICQAIGRVQRKYPGKVKGYVFGIDDGYIRKIIHEIQDEISIAAKLKQKDARSRNPNPFNSTPKVNPLFTKLTGYKKLSDNVSVSSIEKLLRRQLENIIEAYIEDKSKAEIDGDAIIVTNMNAKRRMLIWDSIRLKVNAGRDEKGKLVRVHVEEMSIYQLEEAIKVARSFHI